MTEKQYSSGILIHCLILFSCLVCIGTVPALAAEQMVENDPDKNGIIDQRAFYNEAKKMIRLEVDSDQDGKVEVIQYYEDEKLSRVERDTDLDGKMDCIDHYEKDIRQRQERLDKHKKLIQVTRFSKDGLLPVTMEKDSSGDGKFDTFYTFSKGLVATLEKDTTGTGTMNAWVTYKDGKPVEEKRDENEDGKMELVLDYDGEGLPLKSRHDQDADGFFEAVRFYRKGEIVRQERDEDKNGKADTLTEYENSQPVLQKKDTTFSGALPKLFTPPRTENPEKYLMLWTGWQG